MFKTKWKNTISEQCFHCWYTNYNTYSNDSSTSTGISLENCILVIRDIYSLFIFKAHQKLQQDNTKEKCRKFLANLLELSSKEPKLVERSVRTLIQELVDAKVEPEQFCDRLEKLLNASPQPCLIGFLKVSFIIYI